MSIRFAWAFAPALAASLILPASAADLKSGIDLSNVDPAVKPQDDLFRHVNGKWLKEAAIPSDRSSDGAFYKLRDDSETQLRALIEEAAKQGDAAKGEAKKVGDLYASFMDEEKIEALGVKPIQPELDEVAAIKDKAGFFKTLVSLQKAGVPGLFGAGVEPDAKKSDQYAVYMFQGGIGLPDEMYYRDPKFAKIRDAYVKHIAKMFELAKLADPEKAAATVMAVETKLAASHWDRVRSRDADKTYNKFSKADLATLAKGVDLAGWIDDMGAKGVDHVVVAQPSYFTGMAEAVSEISLDDWKTYLTWNILRDRAPMLSKAFVNENFEFFGKTLSGIPELRPRWKRGVQLVEGSLGEAAGQLYVAKHFPPQAKERMKVLVKNLIEAYREDIQHLDWMSAETKKKALEKLDKFTPKIGYPDKWRDYSKLDIDRGDLIGNTKRSSAFGLNYEINKLGKPIDRYEWGMTPQTVNAYYNPLMNEIVFPAAILQPPFFDLNADDAVNYGGIGAVIGHEIGHGFDDQGAKFDGTGNLQNWWGESDLKEFGKRAKKLIEQYNAFEPAALPGQHVNGALTIGENIGDLGGLAIAYKAYKISLGGKPSPVIDGLTGEQRLFIGWAQVWRSKHRDAEAIKRLTTDPHSPAEFRCNGVVRNLKEFHDAFGVKKGDKLWLDPEERVRIW